MGCHLANLVGYKGEMKTRITGLFLSLMSRVYERPFEVSITTPEAVPAEKEISATLGGHLDGCRIGFDLGASDFKVAAVKDGEPVYSDEFPWNPKDNPDPEYHYSKLTEGLKKAAAKLPRVDAIGGSSAGVIVDNKIMSQTSFWLLPFAFSSVANLPFAFLGLLSFPESFSNRAQLLYGVFCTAQSNQASLLGLGTIATPRSNSSAANPFSIDSHLSFHNVFGSDRVPSESWDIAHRILSLFKHCFRMS